MDDELLNEVLDCPRVGPDCTVLTALTSMDKETRETFEHLLSLDKARAPHNAISRALKKRGHDISGSTVGRHRKGECACGRRPAR